MQQTIPRAAGFGATPLWRDLTSAPASMDGAMGGKVTEAIRAAVQEAGAIEVTDGRIIGAVMALAMAQIAADEANEAVRCCAAAWLSELRGVSVAG